MAEVLLYHHVQGMTDGVRALADRLREAGHTVHTPDLFGGRTFETLDEGMDHAREVGFGVLQEQGVEAADGLPAELVYVGLSLGVMMAQRLAQTRPGARGAVFLHACLPVGEFGGQWPAGVAVQVHGMDGDPFFAGEDLDAARELVRVADRGDLFTYPGDAHLFTDSSLPGHDEAATDVLVGRVLELLNEC